MDRRVEESGWECVAAEVETLHFVEFIRGKDAIWMEG